MKALTLFFGWVMFLTIVSVSATQLNAKETAMDDLKEIVKPFYTQCLSVNPDTDVTQVMENLLADSFQSIGSEKSKNKEVLTGQVKFFWQLIPDLKWEIQEMFQDGNRVIVRSIATGTPSGDFMGVPTNGSKSFKIMTIDVHTVENGQISKVYHLEDWPTAMQQLK